MLTLCLVAIVLLFCCLLSMWAPHAALGVFNMADHLFVSETKEDMSLPAKNRPAKIGGNASHRGYISPYTKKLVASRQGWRCATCNKMLDASYEIDHRKPLFKGGSNDISNLQALCRSPCHIQKSARER